MDRTPITSPNSGARLTDEERIAETLTADAERLTSAERRAEVVVGGAFLVAATLLMVLFPPGSPDWAVIGLVVVAMAVAYGVRFPVPSGFTAPCMLVLVPALFVLPAALVPPVTASALVLGRVPEVVRGTSSPHRLLLVCGNAWFAVGPAVVFGVTGTTSVTPMAVGVLVVALLAQIACDLVVSAVWERLAHGLELRDQVAEAAWVYAVDIALTPVGLLVALAVKDTPLALGLLLPLLGLLQVFAAERRDRMEQLVELGNAYRGTAMVLGDVVESDDAYTGEHTRGVVELALAVGDQLRLPPEVMRRVEFGALLHDVGKVAVPKEIINKAGPLDPHEWEVIKTHTLEGQRMLDTVGGLMRQIGIIVRAHHERWDGGGYPDGLAGEQIPIESRIVSACDTWNAMTTTRSYRSAMSKEAALAELLSVSGTQLDPAVVDALVAVLEGMPASALVAEAPAEVAAVVSPPGRGTGGDEATSVSTVTAAAADGHTVGRVDAGGLRRVMPVGERDASAGDEAAPSVPVAGDVPETEAPAATRGLPV